MNKYLCFGGAALMTLAYSLYANGVPRRATITRGGFGGGTCTVQVNVDHSAEVEVWGDMAELRTLAGQDAFWRRFECTAPMPRFTSDFQMRKMEGRGRITLAREPRTNYGRARVRIDDPKGGRATYTFALVWRGSNGPGWNPGPPAGPPPPGPPPGNGVQACQNAVRDRLNQYGYPTVSFGRVAPQNNPRRDVWITGTATGQRKSRSAVFSYSCAVDSRSGRVRSLDVQPK